MFNKHKGNTFFFNYRGAYAEWEKNVRDAYPRIYPCRVYGMRTLRSQSRVRDNVILVVLPTLLSLSFLTVSRLD